MGVFISRKKEDTDEDDDDDDDEAEELSASMHVGTHVGGINNSPASERASEREDSIVVPRGPKSAPQVATLSLFRQNPHTRRTLKLPQVGVERRPFN